MTEETYNDLDELFKIPLENQHQSVIDKLYARRKELFNIFYDKSKTAEQRNAVFDEANKISNYLKAKGLKWKIKTPGSAGSKRIATKEEREANCLDFIAFCTKYRLEFNGNAVALVWGPA